MQHTNIVNDRLQALDILINDKEITIVNIYGPNNDDTALFNKLEEYMKENQEKTFIIGGDFNTVLNENLDKRNGRTNTHILCRNKIKHITETFDLIDIWRDMHPNLRQYTWHSSHKPPIFCRLDYVLISQNLKNCIVSTKHNINYKSDSNPVVLKINILNIKRGPGYFKLNSSLLLDTLYQENVKQSRNETILINRDANPNTLWELIKDAVRNETINMQQRKRKNQQSAKTLLRQTYKN